MMTVRRVVAIAVYSAVRVSFGGVLYRFMTCTQGEMTSHNLCSRYDRHYVGITRNNVCS